MAREPLSLVWLQSGGCGGCTLSLLGADAPDLLATLAAANIEVLWHPSLSEASGVEARTVLADIAEGRRKVDTRLP